MWQGKVVVMSIFSEINISQLDEELLQMDNDCSLYFSELHLEWGEREETPEGGLVDFY